MADDVLSQAELEALLNSLDFDSENTSAANERSLRATQSPAAQAKSRPTASPQKAVPYDFKRPQRLSFSVLHALETLHESLCRGLGVSLSALLRSVVEVKLARVEQLTYSEFIFNLENPTCFNVLRSRPVTGQLALDIQPSILYPIIDRLLGGGREKSPIVRRPITEIESRLVARITALFLQELVKAWRNVVELELMIDRVESNPQAVEAAPANESVAVVVLAVSINDARGAMSLCLPWPWLHQVVARLAVSPWAMRARGTSRRPGSAASSEAQASAVELAALLAETKVTAGELFDLGVGDIITTEQDAHSSIILNVNGVPRFRALPGALDTRKAAQIEEVLGPPAEG